MHLLCIDECDGFDSLRGLPCKTGPKKINIGPATGATGYENSPAVSLGSVWCTTFALVSFFQQPWCQKQTQTIIHRHPRKKLPFDNLYWSSQKHLLVLLPQQSNFWGPSHQLSNSYSGTNAARGFPFMASRQSSPYSSQSGSASHKSDPQRCFISSQ